MYTLRQARNELGKRILANLEDEDIEHLFEDLLERETTWRKIETGPEGHRISTFTYDTPKIFKNKESRKNMQTARDELIHLIREWMSFHGIK